MTDLSVLSASEAVKFLEWLDPLGRHNLVAIDPVTKAVNATCFKFGHEEFGEAHATRWIGERNGKQNLYFSINEPSPAARIDTKLRRDEIGAVRAFHVDIDNLDGAPDWDMDCLPSAVIDSGGGRWGFWKLADKVPVEDVAAIEAQNRALTARFHGDTQAHNLDRIARLPGTLNIPNEAKRKKGRVEAVSKVVTLAGPTWTAGEVADWCAPLTTQAAPATLSAGVNMDVEQDTPASVSRAIGWLLREAPEAELGNGSNGTTYQVAAKMRDFGLSQSVAFELLLDHWNESKSTPPWPAAKLQTMVAHAYRYGTAALGKNSPALAETEFEATAIEDAPKPTKHKMQAEDFASITEDFDAAPHYLIDGWYDQQALVVTYGESNSGKTHVVLDQAMAIAAGRPWAGKPVHQGLVVYVAAEGGRGVRRRVMGHRLFRPEYASLPFSLVSYPINLMHAAADAKALVALVREAEARYSQKCMMVVVDTLSRALAGGDENSSADMGAFVKRCDEIRAATGCSLHIVHHAGKNTAKGARGHSLLRAAVDTEIEIENNTILSRKQRDMEGATELRFAYKPVTLGRQGDRDVISVVLDVWETSEFEMSLTPQTQKVLDALEAMAEKAFGVSNLKDEQNQGTQNPKLQLSEIKALGFPSTTLDRAINELLGFRILAKSKRGLYELKRNPKTP